MNWHDETGRRFLLTVRQVLVVAVSILLAVQPPLAPAAENAASVEKRLARFTRLLSSDELEGRGIGTKGLNLAANAIADEFQQLGLNAELYDHSPFQKFTVTTAARMGQTNALAFIGPEEADSEAGERIDLQLGEDFHPLAIGGAGKFDLPLVFAGYGITGKEEGYDDYANIDVRGKAVIILRHEPQQNNPHSKFNGTEPSRYAPFRRKVSNAFQHGAAAVIFCTSRFEIDRRVAQFQRRWQVAVDDLVKANAEFKTIADPSRSQLEEHRRKIDDLLDQVKKHSERLRAAYDPVLKFTAAGEADSRRDMPAVHCRRAVLDRVLKAAVGKDLATLEREIDDGPTPHSVELASWHVRGEITVERDEVEVKNVVAVLEGEGPRAEETIVIGAHYDHLGRGGASSASPVRNEIYNGADDNASGTAVLLEVARRLASREEKLPRRVVFIAFTGEERGLLGSAEYVRDPLFPLEKTVAMLNMDMVGRMKDNKLIINGTGTAEEFSPWIDELNERLDFRLTKSPSGYGPSDHQTFYVKKIPVLHFFTGSHSDYHRPSDDFEKINIPDMRRVSELVAELAVRIAQSPDRPQYREVTSRRRVEGQSGARPYFGSIPDFGQTGDGYTLSGVAPESPAARAGVRGGDTIVRFGNNKIGNLEDFDGALRKYQAGDKVRVLIRRGGQELTLEVTLDPPR